MSVYKNDDIADFVTSVNSIYKQTIPPDEIILVIDGPIRVNLQDAINELQKQIPILKVNLTVSLLKPFFSQ